MRYLLYGIIFCLSCFFLIRPLSSSSQEPAISPGDMACRFMQTYSYQDLSPRQVKTVCGVASIIRSIPKSKAVEEFHFHSVDGVFYRNPTDDTVLFLPPSKPKFMIGRGCHKKVYRAILFAHEQAELVAACVGDKSIVHEAEILKMLSLGGGTLPFRTFFPLSHDKFMLVLRHYNMGGLSGLYKKNYPFTLKQKLAIVHGVAHALYDMHTKGVAHRDLHDGNILLHARADGTIESGLIDFGRAKPIYSKSKDRPQGAGRRNPPEVLYKVYPKIDKLAADVYALGCSFYKLMYEKEYEAVGTYDIHAFRSISEADKKKALLKVESIYARTMDALAHSEVDQVESLQAVRGVIIHMLHPDPSSRPGIRTVVEVVDKAFSDIKIASSEAQ